MNGPVIALTGATGFIGRYLLSDLQRRGYRVRVLLRRPTALPPVADSAVVGDLTAPRNMAVALEGVEAVIHSAGLAHTMSGAPEDDYRALNTEATVALALAAKRAGVRRFVFMSSIRAQTGPTSQSVLTEDMDGEPTDAYGRSKRDAERGLAELDIDWVALRPVLVYGPGVKGNMATLVALARSRLPLPVGGLKARRSLLALNNLAGAVDTVLRAGTPLRRPFIVADDEVLTVAEILAHLRAGLGRAPGLLPVPQAVVALGAAMVGRRELYQRLAGPLVVDTSALRRLGFVPPLTTAEGLRRLAAVAPVGRIPG
jgi:nucleoside-diphosphate-sugar epimerase